LRSHQVAGLAAEVKCELNQLKQTAVSYPPSYGAREKIQHLCRSKNYAKNVFLRFGRGGFVIDGPGAKCAGAVAVGNA
jgi:hypothetical protein